MTDPDQVDRWRETFRLAHEAIYDIHRRLVVTRVATDHTRELLAESALIATTKGPRLTESARSLAIEYIDRSVMDPAAAAPALAALHEELRRVGRDVSALIERQMAIARELRELLSDQS